MVRCALRRHPLVSPIWTTIAQRKILKEFEKGRVIVDVNLRLGESFDINKAFTTLEKKNQAFFQCDNRSDMKKILFPMNYWIFRFSGMLRNSIEIVWVQLSHSNICFFIITNWIISIMLSITK